MARTRKLSALVATTEVVNRDDASSQPNFDVSQLGHVSIFTSPLLS